MKFSRKSYHIIRAICWLLPLWFVTSCKDYLNVDRYFDDEFNIDSVFSSTRYMESYMWGESKSMGQLL